MTNLAYKLNTRTTQENINYIRRNGQVPGIIYGEFLKESLPIKINKTNLITLLKNNSKGSIIPVEINNEVMNCVVKTVQKNIKGELIHVDFQYVQNNETIKMSIPIRFTGQENLEAKRLVLEIHTPSLEFQGPVEAIPESIQVDVSQMNFEEQVLAKDIEIPDSIKLINEPDTILAIINS